MKVYLRKKALNNGKQSLYFDIYLSSGERYYEFPKLYLVKARNNIDKQKNKETLELAKSTASKRELELQANEYDYTPAFKRKIDFITFYEKFVTDYSNKDIRIVKYSLYHFKEFIKSKRIKRISVKQVSESLCKEYKQYLESNLNGETPYNYFTKFKKVLKQAVKDKIISVNPADEIHNQKQEGLKKDILDIDEIKKLSKTDIGNKEIKKAFLFSLNTGLRYCDVKELRWKNIDLISKKLIITQSKTKYSSNHSQLINDLNNTALKLIGERGKPDDLVFHIPSIASCLKNLHKWTAKAGIDKHITWHSARHSYAVNLLRTDVGTADIKTVSSLLGHSGLKHTEKYLRVVDELKRIAVNRLPELDV